MKKINSKNKLHNNAQKVQDAILAKGLSNKVVQMPETTRTSEEAANSIGCKVAQIAKSLVFKGKSSNKPYMVIASGSNRVNEKLLKQIVNEKIRRPDAVFVKGVTGYPIGGVPPFAHVQEIETIIDEDLMQFSEIWAAAGHPHAVFKLTPKELLTLTNGNVQKIC